MRFPARELFHLTLVAQWLIVIYLLWGNIVLFQLKNWLLSVDVLKSSINIVYTMSEADIWKTTFKKRFEVIFIRFFIAISYATSL